MDRFRYSEKQRRAMSVASAVVFVAGLLAIGVTADRSPAAPGSEQAGDVDVAGIAESVSGDGAANVTSVTGPATAPGAAASAASPGSASGPGAAVAAPSAPTPRSVSGSVPIGILWLDTAQANAAVTAVAGGSGAFEGDQKHQAELVVAHINASGGIAGRKVEPVYHQLDLANQVTKEGRNREAQSMCATFTEDNQVFAIVSGGVSLPEPLIVDCAHSAKTPLIMSKPDAMAYLSEQKVAEVAGHYYWPAGMTAERRERTAVAGWQRQGLLPKDARVGLMIQDDPYIKAGVERALKPALAALGITPVQEAVYPDFIEAPWSTYVLAMQSADVDVVLFSANMGSVFPPLLFMRSADNQEYSPKYGLTTDGSPCGLLSLGAPERQMRNIQFVGWSPVQDVCGLEEVSANDKECRAIYRDAGQPEVGNGNGMCEGLFLLREALRDAASPTVAALASGVAGFGTKAQSVWAMGTRFEGNGNDGAAVVRDGAYDSGCKCFKYTGPPHNA